MPEARSIYCPFTGYSHQRERKRNAALAFECFSIYILTFNNAFEPVSKALFLVSGKISTLYDFSSYKNGAEFTFAYHVKSVQGVEDPP